MKKRRSNPALGDVEDLAVLAVLAVGGVMVYRLVTNPVGQLNLIAGLQNIPVLGGLLTGAEQAFVPAAYAANQTNQNQQAGQQIDAVVGPAFNAFGTGVNSLTSAAGSDTGTAFSGLGTWLHNTFGIGAS